MIITPKIYRRASPNEILLKPCEKIKGGLNSINAPLGKGNNSFPQPKTFYESFKMSPEVECIKTNY